MLHCSWKLINVGRRIKMNFSSGGGIASDEDSLGLPLIVNDLESIRPHLNFFVHLYGLNCVSSSQLHCSFVLSIIVMLSFLYSC